MEFCSRAKVMSRKVPVCTYVLVENFIHCLLNNRVQRCCVFWKGQHSPSERTRKQGQTYCQRTKIDFRLSCYSSFHKSFDLPSIRGFRQSFCPIPQPNFPSAMNKCVAWTVLLGTYSSHSESWVGESDRNSNGSPEWKADRTTYGNSNSNSDGYSDENSDRDLDG
jgi:hypothetical protein